MKILIATGAYAPDIGGPATYVKILEKMLPEQGISVSIVPFRSVIRLPRFIRHLVYSYYLFRAGKDTDLI